MVMEAYFVTLEEQIRALEAQKAALHDEMVTIISDGVGPNVLFIRLTHAAMFSPVSLTCYPDLVPTLRSLRFPHPPSSRILPCLPKLPVRPLPLSPRR